MILGMVVTPRVFAKAQEEIDRVVGRERLPQITDRQDLPYIEAIVKEAYRYGLIFYSLNTPNL